MAPYLYSPYTPLFCRRLNLLPFFHIVFWTTSMIPRGIQCTQDILKTLLHQGIWTIGHKSPFTLNFSFKYCQLHCPDRFNLFYCTPITHWEVQVQVQVPGSRHVLPGRFREWNHLVLLPGHKSPFLCCHIRGLLTVPNNISQHVRISHYKQEEVFGFPGDWVSQRF